MIMETIIIHTGGSKLKLIKQLLKELSIDFEVGSKTKSMHNQEFVAKILKAKSESSIPVNAESLWEDIK
jgi:hypothetical protein